MTNHQEQKWQVFLSETSEQETSSGVPVFSYIIQLLRMGEELDVSFCSLI